MGPLASVLRSPQLRRAQLAFAFAWASKWAFTVALSVVAYRDGGATAVGLVALLGQVPAALLTPVVSGWADRARREHVMAASSAVRALAIGAAAASLALGAPPGVVYAFAVVVAIAETPYRAAHSALLPSLCTTAAELAACNVVRGMIDSISLLAGPLVAAILLEVTSVETVLAVTAVAAAASALVALGLRYETAPRAATATAAGGGLAEAWRAIRGERDVLAMLALTGAQTFTRGALTVLTVVLAIDLLEQGEPAIGLLTAAVGAGAVAGSVVAAFAAGRGLAGMTALSTAAWGLPLCLIAAVPEPAVAIGALALVGVANAFFDVGLFTLIARLVPDAVLARTFGAVEAVVAFSVGLGSIAAPAVIALAGARGALAIVGAVAPIVALLAWRRLRPLDETLRGRDAEIAALRDVSLLRVLPMPAIESLAQRAERVAVGTGEDVVREGEVGDRYYVIAAGEAVASDRRQVLRTMGAGDGFGEIALLRDVPRTATVRASTPLELLAIGRADFLIVVAGYAPASAAASAVVADRLARSAS